MNTTISGTSTTAWARVAKRGFDVGCASLLILIGSPVLLGIAMLVKLTSRGTVFFAQDRAGQGGLVFLTRKFRTMRGGRTPDPRELVPLDHPEITPIGRFLRRTKLDELPQLWNVVCGEMSLVGPRPTLPDQAEAYDDFRRQRLLVRPGITGLAQVNGDAAMSWDERILYDVVYVQRHGFLMDLGILLRTVLVVIGGEGRTTRAFAGTPYAGLIDVPEGYPVRVDESD